MAAATPSASGAATTAARSAPLHLAEPGQTGTGAGWDVAFALHTPLHARCRAPWLRFLVRTLARCGPVGIKWAQWASTRYDLFEEDVCETLGELTNQAPSMAHTGP